MLAVLAKRESRSTGARRVTHSIKPMLDSRSAAARAELVYTTRGDGGAGIVRNVEIPGRIEGHPGRLEAICRGTGKSSDEVGVGELSARLRFERGDTARRR